MDGDSDGCRRVMVVDDDPVNLILAIEVLSLFEVEVVACATGEQALKAFDQLDFGLVLMDVHLPGLSGLKVTELIRQREADAGRAPTPIVALTASAMPEELQACLQGGMDEVLCKPFALGDMRSLLQRWCILPETRLPAGRQANPGGPALGWAAPT